MLIEHFRRLLNETLLLTVGVDYGGRAHAAVVSVNPAKINAK